MKINDLIRPGAIFDLDGTILESLGVWRQIDIDFLGKRGIPVPEDYMREISLLGFDAAAIYTKERFGLSEPTEDIIKEWFDMAIHAYTYDIDIKPGAREYLHWLKNHDIRLAVATSSDERLYVPALKRHGLYELFETFVESADVERGKGFPDVYEKAARDMELPVEECVVYEDLLQALLGAKAGGFYTVGIYDENGAADWSAIEQQADFAAWDYARLLGMVGE